MPLPRFDKLPEQRRLAILDAASEEFAQAGFEAASMNRVLERAELSKGAAYYYFADKSDLYATVLAHAQDRWLAATGMPENVIDADSYWRECEAMYARLLEFLATNPIDARLCWAITRARARGDAHPALATLFDHLFELNRAMVQLGQNVGAVRTDLPEDLLVILSFALLEGMDRWFAEHWDELSADRVKENVTLMVGLMRRLASSHES